MKFGLMGKVLKHSWSKEIHEKLHDYEYDIIEIDESNLKSFIKNNEYKGLNVTIPYKQSVIPFCYNISKSARRIGSVNTLVYDDWGVTGYNTDYYGFIYMCRRSDISFRGKKVMILGSGGTSKTAVTAAEDTGASQITVISRNGKNTYADINRFKDHEIIINTTPVGMYPDNNSNPVDIDLFPNCSGIIDVVYNPIRTNLILQAKKRGIPCTGGLPMLVSQAYYAGEIFVGNTEFNTDVEQMTKDVKIESIIMDMLNSSANMVLIGMSGCGKTHIGRMLSEITKKTFIDTDAEIEVKTGISIPEIFSENGEPFFREVESEVIAEVSKKKGQIIATGGGAVLSDINVNALRQNGIMIWLKRGRNHLTSGDFDSRPLINDNESAAKLYKKRKEIYEKSSDIKVYNDGNGKDTVHDIIKQVASQEML